MNKEYYSKCDLCDLVIPFTDDTGDLVLCAACRASLETKTMTQQALKIPNVSTKKHYSRMAMEPIEFIKANKLRFEVGNIIKYVCRYEHKDGIKDLEKAQDYLNMLKDEWHKEHK